MTTTISSNKAKLAKIPLRNLNQLKKIGIISFLDFNTFRYPIKGIVNSFSNADFLLKGDVVCL